MAIRRRSESPQLVTLVVDEPHPQPVRQLPHVERRGKRHAHVRAAGTLGLDRPACTPLELLRRLVEPRDDHGAGIIAPPCSVRSGGDGATAAEEPAALFDLASGGACSHERLLGHARTGHEAAHGKRRQAGDRGAERVEVAQQLQ